MKKKLLIALPVCVLSLILLAFLLFFKGADMLTLPQLIEVDGYLAVNPFFDEETGEEKAFVNVAAADNNEAAPKNSFLWFLNRYDKQAGYVELDIAFDSKGLPCLADSYEEALGDSVAFDRVLRHMYEKQDETTGLVVNLTEYSNLESLSAALCQNGFQRRAVITGVNELSVSSVKKYFREIPVLCTYDSDTKSSLEQLKELGADGIICPSDKVSKSLINKAKELDLLVWVRCENEFYGTVKAMNFCVDGVVSTVPEVACIIRDSWGENVIDDVKGIKDVFEIK